MPSSDTMMLGDCVAVHVCEVLSHAFPVGFVVVAQANTSIDDSLGIPRLSGSCTRVLLHSCSSVFSVQNICAIIFVVTARTLPRVQAKDNFDYRSWWLTLQGVIDDGASLVTAQNSAPSLLISTLGGEGQGGGGGGYLLDSRRRLWTLR